MNEKYLSNTNWGEIEEKARKLGFEYEKIYHGCGQSVVAALTESLGEINNDLFDAATGLSGGIGLCSDASCSAFTGSAMVIGLIFPRRRDHFDGDRESKYTNFKLVDMLRKKYEKEFDSTICGQIHTKLYGRPYDMRSKAERELFESAGGHNDQGCPYVVSKAAQWTIEILAAELSGMNNK